MGRWSRAIGTVTAMEHRGRKDHSGLERPEQASTKRSLSTGGGRMARIAAGGHI